MRVLQTARMLVLAFAAAFSVIAPATAETFPALSGRVVDEANILDQGTRSSLDALLASLEAKTTDQVVVATVPSLRGHSIEAYATVLFNRWGLGQKDKNNGVLLLVAPTERKVRIEVGRGLAGRLTDATAKRIIDDSMVPHFRTGDMAAGVTLGVRDIVATLSMLAVLGGDDAPASK
jgi:uncharacterized protein